MRKIELIDCENFSHKIALMISDDKGTFYAIAEHEGLSDRQIAKLEAFEQSCPGPYMVPGLYYSDNRTHEIVCSESDFSTIYVYSGESYIHIEFHKRIQGQRSEAYRIPKEHYKGIDSILEDISMMNFNGESEAGYLSRIWQGPVIY